MRLSIGAKLAAAFGAVLAITATLGLLGLSEIRTVNRHAMHINDETVPSVENIDAATSAIEVYRQDQFRHLSVADKAKVDTALLADRQAAATAFRVYKPHIADAIDRRSFENAPSQWAAYRAATAKVAALS